MNLNAVRAVFRREFDGYFATPLAYVFIVIFLRAMGSFTIYFGQFYDAARAELNTCFAFHPWLYRFLNPAISMRLWAEEQKTGTLELLMTLPISFASDVVGKFLAAWAFAGLALGLTFPMWLTVNFLGKPDNGGKWRDADYFYDFNIDEPKPNEDKENDNVQFSCDNAPTPKTGLVIL